MSITPTRRATQLEKVLKHLTSGGQWTLGKLARCTGAPEASVSARIRDIRRLGYNVSVKRASPKSGLHVYQIV